MNEINYKIENGISDTKTSYKTEYLPTIEEYKKSIENISDANEWSEPKFKCPKCAIGRMHKNNTIVLTTYPVKYLYKCDNCDHIEYLFN